VRRGVFKRGKAWSYTVYVGLDPATGKKRYTAGSNYAGQQLQSSANGQNSQYDVALLPAVGALTRRCSADPTDEVLQGATAEHDLRGDS